MKKSIILLFLLASCATIQEAEEVQSSYITKAPAIAGQLDSVQTSRVRSIIQSSPSTILSNSIVCRSGEWSIDLSVSEADSLGVSKELYKEYEKKVQELNHLSNNK